VTTQSQNSEETMDEQQTPFPHDSLLSQATDPSVTSEPTETPPPRQRVMRRLLATATATALVAGVGGIGAGYAVGHGGFGSSTRATSSGTGGIDVPSLPFGDGYGGQSTVPQNGSWGTTSQVTGTQLTGLVRVVSTLKYEGGEAAGTGMVLTSDGEVVTNHHVVAGATSVEVTVMSTGKSYRAEVVGTDTKDDVAVLKLVGASGLSTVTADTDGIGVGSAVTAVGDANGTVSTLSAAPGRVLALRQTITTQSEGAASGERLTGLIEISSDVISGDSGGATYEADGEVVGMTTAASSGGSDIVGYAVPIAKVLRIVDDLDSGVSGSRYDYTRPAFLGVGLDGSSTTVLGAYAGTPADSAGIAEGDRITAVGSTRVRTSAQLRRAVAAHSPGDTIRITWTDPAGSSHSATVTLAAGAVE
jgi:S1-C subfamily serine protease